VWGISRSPGTFTHRDRFTRNFLARGDDLADAVSPTDSQIANDSFTNADSFQSPHMGIGQVVHMHIIANAGTVRGIIVGAKNFDEGPEAQRGL
jgi:hypothetical protein